jgi:chemotaxis protein CheD
VTEFVDVDTGEVQVTSKAAVLRAMAIGSCVVVVAFDRGRKIGGLAHIMLPDKSIKEEREDKTKYAVDAIDKLLEKFKNLGIKIEDLEISLIGGADLLGESPISELIVSSVLDYLKSLGIEPRQQKLGGKQRRSVSLDISSGKIHYTEGDSQIRELR